MARAAATAQIASSYITACSKVDVEALIEENDELKKKILVEEKRRKDAVKYASEKEAESKKLEKDLDLVTKEKEKLDLLWSKSEADVETERERAREQLLEATKLRSLIDELKKNHLEELNEVKETSFQQGRDMGFDEGASSLLYTTWLHFPNKKCSDFFFTPYGETGKQILDEFVDNADCKAERVEVQQVYEGTASVLVDPPITTEPTSEVLAVDPSSLAEDPMADNQAPPLPSDQP